MPDESRARGVLIGSSFALLAVIAFGLLWFFFGAGAASPVGFGWYVFSFAAGLSMIVLPCTLPLAFVIVPLSMGKGTIKGFAIAIFFGLGVAITLSLYGVFAAVLGKVAIGSLGAPLEVVKNWLYFVAGGFAYLFALGELGLVKYRMPSFSGAFPAFIQRQQDVVKAFLLGLLLGNIGVGCPHPATPVILTRIAVSGDVFYGWLLFFVHAIGRILPLIFLAILGILGINALSGLVSKKEKIERATGWAMVFVASFILVLGLFSHDWWVLSGQHTFLEEITQEEQFLGIISSRLRVAAPHEHGLPPADHTGLFGLPLAWGTWVLLLLWIVPFLWYYMKRKQQIISMPDSPEKQLGTKTLPYLLWNSVTLTLLLIVTFGYALPARFLYQAGAQGRMDEHMEEMMGHPSTGSGQVAHGVTHYHEEADVKEGIAVNLGVLPEAPNVNETATLQFFVNIKPEEIPVSASELQIQHEKRMHVMGVRRDLNEFFHIHPTLRPPDFSTFSIPYVFQKAGEYKIWSEIKYRDENHVFGHPIVTLKGGGATFDLQKEILINRIVLNYQVALHYDELLAGRENQIHFTIKDLAGRAVPLENYLGEKMHLAVIPEDLSQLIHTHPESGSGDHSHASFVPRAFAHGVEENGVPAEEIGFIVMFPKAGFYKLFAQFRPADTNLPPEEALTAEFWVNVKETGAEKAELTDPRVLWWRNLIVSLVLIALLSWGVKKYITVK